MVIFGLFCHEDQIFFIFWYKSKQNASIEVKIVKILFCKILFHLLSDILLIILLNILGLC